MAMVLKASTAMNELHNEVFSRAMDGKGFKPRHHDA